MPIPIIVSILLFLSIIVLWAIASAGNTASVALRESQEAKAELRKLKAELRKLRGEPSR